ncbi:MAG: aminotransferase class I/II-fold pyridoxal phosphate-dependent enzyme, partial [Rhodobacteraceae bacterium]|nr:aminotransferase class I/II-fold pyridoxal phosphate-dependent enzyme [Paracoccaceae bacterium]
MLITPFGVEIWMNAHETQCRYNLAETCVHSLTIAGLLSLAGRNEADLSALLPMQMTYGAIEGSDRLRAAICALYQQQTPGNITVTHGTIGANDLVYRALVGPGDIVVSLTPTYQQHTAIPASLGATVRMLPLRAEQGFLPDIAALRSLATGARQISLTNPNNPTGALIPPEMLLQIVDIARAEGAYLLCDEVYRGTEQQDASMSPAIADLYERGISTCGMSKAFSLAGLRLGWIAAPSDLHAEISRHRDYNTISVGMIDDHLAAIALEAAPRILARSRAITGRNLALLDAWVAATPGLSYVRPQAGTTAMVAFAHPLSSRALCQQLLADT